MFNASRAESSRLPLYCFPYGGAGASAYRGWGGELPGWLDVRPMQFPGRENRFREPPYTRLEPLVAEMAERVETGTPYALFGHSLGALVAFELTRTLRRAGRPTPSLLVLSGFGSPPQLRDRTQVSHLEPDAFWEAVAVHYDVTPEVLAEPLLRELAYPVLRADLEIVETYVYRPEPPLDLPMVAWGGVGDPEATEAQVAAWQEHNRQPVEVRIFPGGHFYINSSRPAVLAALAATARRVTGR